MSLVDLIRFEPSALEIEQENLKLGDRIREEYQRGYQEGMVGVERKYQIKTEAKAKEIVSGIQNLSSRVQAIAAEIECQAGELAASAISSVLPELARRGMASEMALAVRELVGRLEPPQLRITGPEPLLDAIREQLDQADQPEMSLPITLEPDSDVQDGHATLEWPTGRADFTHGDMLERVTRSLNSLMMAGRLEFAGPTQEGDAP